MQNLSSPQIIEQYQILLQNEPGSKVFAPVAEYYRKNNWLKEAIFLCKNGLEENPGFSSGLTVLAHCHFDQGEYKESAYLLEKSIYISPENILSHFLLGQSYLKLNKIKKAISEFKMVLFLNPQHKIAKVIIKKLKNLSPYDDPKEIFEMVFGPQKSINSSETNKKAPDFINIKSLERKLALADTYKNRSELKKARDTLYAAENEFGSRTEISERLKILNSEAFTPYEEVRALKPLAFENEESKNKKIKVLKKLLNKLENNI